MTRRLAPLIGATLAGIAVGVAGDFFFWNPSVSTVLWALLFSPIVVTLGGGFAVSNTPLPMQLLFPLFLVGGCLFWPLYALLVIRWWRNPRPLYLLVIFLWTAQGFFQVGLRLDSMMGV